MRNSFAPVVVGMAILVGAGVANAQDACAGDCDGDGQVVVNELITGVNIALGSAQLGSCPAFDANSDGSVTVNELILAVNNALNGCPVIGGGEEVTCTLTNSSATVQSTLFALDLNVTGSIVFTIDAVDGNGNAQIVVKDDDLNLNPISVTGLTCACIIALPSDVGDAAVGEIGCGAGGLPELDYTAAVDHNVGTTSLTFTEGGGRGSLLMQAAVGFVIGGDATCAGIDCRTIDRTGAIPLAAPLTSGTSTARILNANGMDGREVGPGMRCLGAPCKVSQTGTPVDCDAIGSGDLESAISGTGIGFAYPALNVETVMDIVVTAIFTCE